MKITKIAVGENNGGGHTGSSPSYLPHTAVGIISILYFAALNGHLSPYGDNADFILLSKGMLAEHCYCLPTLPNPAPHTQFPFVLPIMLMPIVAALGYNFFAMKLLITFTAIASIWLVYRLFRPLVGEWQAILLMFLTGFSPHIGGFSHKVLSEFPFMLLILGALIYLHRYRRDENWRTKNGLVAGIQLILAYFTRSIGLFVAVGAIGYLLFEGISRSNWKLNLKKAISIGVSFALPATAWALRNYQVTTDHALPYLRQFLIKIPYTPDLGTIGAKALWERVRSDYDYYLRDFSRVVFNYRYEKLINTWFLHDFIFYLILAGFVYCLVRRRTAIEYVTLAYMLIVYTWPWRGTRFIVPILPFAIYYFVTGVGWLLSQIGRISEAGAYARSGAHTRRGYGFEAVTTLAVIPLLALGSYPLATHLWGRSDLSMERWLLLAAAGVGAAVGIRVWKRIPVVQSAAIVLAFELTIATLIWHVGANVVNEHREPYYYKINSYWGEYVDMAKWIRRNVPADSVVMCRKPSLMYLLSGHYSALYPFTTSQIRVMNSIAEQRIGYVALDSFTWTDTTRKYLKPVIAAHPGTFVLVHRIGNSAIYRVK